MNSITLFDDFFEKITLIEEDFFKVKTNLQPLAFLKRVSDKIKTLLTDQSFTNSLDKLMNSLNEIIPLLSTIGKEIQKQLASEKFYTSKNKESMQEYADYKVDEKPLFAPKVIQKKPILNYQTIIEQSNYNGLKPIVPISKRVQSISPCPCIYCNAPPEYLYNNNNKGQWLCKVCKSTFNITTTKAKEAGFYCPHCSYSLFKHHKRNGYDVYVCPNNKCSFYLKNKNKQGTSEYDKLLTSTNQYKFRYTFRDFHIDFNNDIKNESLKFDTKVDLRRIHASDNILGLILAYHINYGLSTRKVASLLWDIHKVKISHQTVANYCEAVVPYVQGLVDKYPYKLSNEICGDETYVECRGKHKYVFFFSDVKTKIILSYRIFDNRDTLNAVKSLYMAFSKYKEFPQDFKVITDANPIYNAAQVYYKLLGIEFDLHQVIGLTNKTGDSKTYRYAKQIEERLNRTFKENYYGMNGFDNIRTSNVYMVLYSTFFNFLRRHSSLNYKPPVVLDIFDEDDTMMSKWIKLINFGKNYQYN